jgi:nucleotide-binding universal stress UspA family protein
MSIGRILILTDGESHTAKAEEYALMLAVALPAELVALYVVEQHLKKFTHEIYAVNRNECRAHLDSALAAEGDAGLAQFAEKARGAGITIKTKILYGEPEKVVTDVVVVDGYDIVILGAKHLEGWWQRFESCNLPGRVFKSVNCPLLFVK